MRSRTLSGHVELPMLGFGTYLIRNPEAAPSVRSAIGLGYRHVDTAEVYRNEEGVGQGLRAALADAGLRREDVFVTTKLWPGHVGRGQPAKTRATTIASLDQSLVRLGLDSVDLYLIHSPFGGPHRVEQWAALLELRSQGKARAVGVSNFGVAHLAELEAAGLEAPAANQIELHPWSQKPALVAYLDSHGIVPIAYSSLVPLSSWRAAPLPAGGPGSRAPAPVQSSAKTEAMRADSARDDSLFKRLAAKHHVTEAQILLRWAVERGWPVLPKSTSPDRMRVNADLFSFSLDDDDRAVIAGEDRGQGIAWGGVDPVATAV